MDIPCTGRVCRKGAPKLIDAYGEWKFKPYLIFTAGQFYIPLSLENMTPDEFLESVYRSQVVNALADRNNDVDSSATRRSGYYVQGSYFIVPKVFDVLLKYDSYDPNLSKSNNYSSNYTFSFGYSFTPYTRLQAAYIFQRGHSVAVIKDNYAAIRLQIGFY